MAYGISINTTAGEENILDIRTARVVYSTTLTGLSGTHNMPGFDSSSGGLLVFNATNGPLELVTFDFDNLSKDFTWLSTGPTDFVLMGVRYD
jgi:hypothetical protein